MSWKYVQRNENGQYRTTDQGGSGHKYSTTEQVVDTWIDGKHLHQLIQLFRVRVGK